MGLMDRVKQQASTLAQQANQGMAKLDSLPAQRRADALLRSLGVAVLAERTGRANGDTEAQISQILADIAQHEQQYNVNLVQQAQTQAQQQWQQPQWQGPGEFLTSAPPVDPNAPAMPANPGPGPGGASDLGGQPDFGGFPPATSFPEATPVGPADTDDEAGPPHGGSSFFPPASGA
jgi:hypothetical protein